MVRRSISLEEKVEKAQASVASAKAKYDVAVDELEKLLSKKRVNHFFCGMPVEASSK